MDYKNFFELIITPLAAPFMQKALLEMGLLSILVGTVGSYVVLRKLTFLSLALSHGVFPGVVLAFAFGWNYFVLSLVTGVIISLAIGLVGQNKQVGGDSAIAAIYTGMFGLGIVLVSSVKSFRGLSDILFGRPFGIGWDIILLTGLAVIGALVLTGLFYKELLLSAFDPHMSAAMGLPLKTLEFGALIAITFTVIVGLPAVGNVQLVALLVTAPATARLLTDRLIPMMILASFIALFGSVVGLYLAYHLNFVPGSSIVISLTSLFLLVFLVTTAKKHSYKFA